MSLIKRYATLCLVYTFLLVKAYSVTPYYRQYKVTDGLPSNECYFAHQDKQGYMWFCTDRGVVRFNGVSFKNMSLEAALPDHTIFEIVEGDEGDLLFSTISGRIYHYKEGQGKMRELPIPKWLQKDLMAQKTYLTFGTGTQVFIAKKYNSIFQLDLERPQEIKKSPIHFENNVLYIKEVSKGRFISTYYMQYIAKLEISSTTVDDLYKDDAFDELILENLDGGQTTIPINISIGKHPGLRYLSKLDDTAMAVSMGKYLLLIKGGVIIDSLSFDDEVTALHYSSLDKYFYVGTYDKIFRTYKYIDSQLQLVDKWFTNECITVPYTDKEGGLWAPSRHSGLFYFPHSGRIVEKSPDILKRNGLFNFKAYQDHQYFKVNEGPIYHVVGNQIYPLKEVNGHNSALIKVAWVGKKKVLLSMPDARPDVFFKHGTLRPISEGSLNNLIDNGHSTLIDGDYIIQYQNNNSSWFTNKRHIRLLKYNTLNGKKLTSPPIYEGATMQSNICKWNGRYWWGHVGGVYSADTLLTKIIPHRNLPHRTQYLIPGKEGLWIVTRNDGLKLLKKDSTLISFKKKNGLAGNLSNHVHIDEQNRIWVATSSGVSVLIKEADESYKIINAGKRLGLTHIDARYIHTYKGKLWIYSLNEVFQAEIEDVFRELIDAPIVLSEVQVNQQIIEIKELNNLPSDHNYVSFTVNTLSYLGESNQTYRYRLKGLHDYWVETNNNNFTFAELSPRKYWLELQYLKSDYTWSRSVDIASFTINPALWQRLDIRILFFLLLIGLFYYLIRWRVKLNYQQLTLKMELVHARRRALISQMNPHFIFNSLNSIQRFINLKENDQANHFLTHFSKLMRRVIYNSEQDLISLKEELEALETYLILEKQRFGSRFQYQIEVDSMIDIELIKISPLLVQPFVENAIWHGLMPKKEGGLLLIRFSIVEEKIRILIEDNGIGRKASEKNRKQEERFEIKHTSIGIKNSKERIRLTQELLNQTAYMYIEDLYREGKAKGTRVVILYPLITASYESTDY